MILYRWHGASTNFGDELNPILWPRLLPGFFDDDHAVRFLGIGSVLDQRHPAASVKLVAGAGYGGYEAKPRLDSNWRIQWVRGPRTAAMLGLPLGLALGDPAVLVAPTLGLTMAGGNEIGYMPHFESAARGAWVQAAARAGMLLIDPRDPPLAILQALGRCKMVLSEALHGVIVADAMRVPWIAVRPRASIHRPKWLDWSDTMNLHPRFQRLPPSTLPEWAFAGPLSLLHTTRTWLARHEQHLHRLNPTWLADQASAALHHTMQAEPQLSSEADLDRCQSRMLDAVRALSANPWHTSKHPFAVRSMGGPVAAEVAQRLQVGEESDYQLKPAG